MTSPVASGTISSLGLGSGLDVNTIITKLTDIEKQPLTTLQNTAKTINSKISAYGTIKSQLASMDAVAMSIGSSGMWQTMGASSSNSSAVAGVVTGVPQPGSYSVQVQQLSQAQSTASQVLANGASTGTGSLTIQLGTWSSDLSGFIPGSATAVTVSVGTGEDSLVSVARKINDANAGVTATIISDSTGQRLAIKSNSTGEANGFRIQISDADNNPTDNAGLSRLAFDPAAGHFGMATDLNTVMAAQDARATLNGVPVNSATNTFANLVPGLNLQVAQVTTSPSVITVAQDTASIQKNIQSFVDAYNSLNTTLKGLTSYDTASQTGGLMQGDATTLNLSAGMSRLVMAGVPGNGSFPNLSSVGITLQRDGTLAVDGGKLSNALQSNPAQVQRLFTNKDGNPANNGFGVKFQAFADALLSANGTVAMQNQALQDSLKKNQTSQQQVNDHVAQVQAALQKQYSLLDAKMGKLNALNQYVSQQVTLWNNNSNK